MILEAGAFRVSDYRKPIPERIKMIVLLNAVLRALDADSPPDVELGNLVGCIEDFKNALRGRAVDIDHRPPLQDRSYDTAAGDFIPPQHDPAHLEALIDKQHDQRTFGRRAGAAKTATTAGSDANRRAKTRKIRESEAIHRARLAEKNGNRREALNLLSGVRKRRLRRRKIANRPFSKQHRPIRSARRG